MAIIELDRERFRAGASELMDLTALKKKLDDDLQAIIAKNIELKDTLIVSNKPAEWQKMTR